MSTERAERLFLALGAADPALLERSGRRRRAPAMIKWTLAAAACLTLFCAAAWTLRQSSPPPDGPAADDSPPVTETLRLTGGDVGRLHLEALHYGPSEGRKEFLMYVNEERCTAAWTEGAYVIRPLTPPPAELPECSLTVSHRRLVSLEQAAAEAQAALVSEFSMVLDPEKEDGRVTLTAFDGTESGAAWDAANACITLVDDQAGGVFTLTARFFTEAAEGLGRDFADMADTFQPVPEHIAVPPWLAALQETVDTLLPAVFSGNWTAEAERLLAEDAMVSGYPEDVSAMVSVSAVDISPDSGEAPSSATVSVRHRLSSEEPYDYVTMELIWQEGAWRAVFIGLER